MDGDKGANTYAVPRLEKRDDAGPNSSCFFRSLRGGHRETEALVFGCAEPVRKIRTGRGVRVARIANEQVWGTHEQGLVGAPLSGGRSSTVEHSP